MAGRSDHCHQASSISGNQTWLPLLAAPCLHRGACRSAQRTCHPRAETQVDDQHVPVHRAALGAAGGASGKVGSRGSGKPRPTCCGKGLLPQPSQGPPGPSIQCRPVRALEKEGFLLCCAPLLFAPTGKRHLGFWSAPYSILQKRRCRRGTWAEQAEHAPHPRGPTWSLARNSAAWAISSARQDRPLMGEPAATACSTAAAAGLAGPPFDAQLAPAPGESRSVPEQNAKSRAAQSTDGAYVFS